jgi:DNA-binding transcriptional MerR regulator
MEMRIDELAQRAGVPSRTIRYYTQQGLLAPPALRGRVGYYSPSHLDRLRLIKELQEKRFLPLAVIRTVIRNYEAGADLEAMLAPLEMVFAPRWDASDATDFGRDELAKQAGVPEHVVDAADEMGFLFPRRRGRERRYTRDDVHMLEVADRWLELGLPRELGRLYRDAFEKISRSQVRAFNQAVVLPIAAEELPPDETRQRLLDGYQAMSQTFGRLVSLLHRKLLQQAVESYAETDGEDA